MPRKPNPHHNSIVRDSLKHNLSVAEISKIYELSESQVYAILRKGKIENNNNNNNNNNNKFVIEEPKKYYEPEYDVVNEKEFEIMVTVKLIDAYIEKHPVKNIKDILFYYRKLKELIL